jgi:RNA-binding protein YhbY
MAELTLPEPELRRLRHAGMRIKSKIQVGGAGVTREIVAKIKDKWRTDEVVRVKVNGTPALNMRIFHEIIEVCIRFCQNRVACIELVFGR